MKIVEKAIETTATINAQRQLVFDGPLPVTEPARVRVIILLPREADIDEKEWLRAGSVNSAFGFLRTPEEDIYTLADGRALLENTGRTSLLSSYPVNTWY
jgi:hypothetical protein